MGFFNYQTEKIEGLRVDSDPKIFFHGTCRKISEERNLYSSERFSFCPLKSTNGVTKMVSMDSTVASQFPI